MAKSFFKVTYVLIMVILINLLPSYSNAQTSDSNKKQHALFGHNNDGNGIKHITQEIDTLVKSTFEKYRDSTKYHQPHFDHLKQYHSGLYELDVKDINVHELLDDIAKAAGYTFTYIGDVDQKITVHIDNFFLDYMIDELCYISGMLAVKDQKRFIIYGNGAEDVIDNQSILYNYSPRYSEVETLMSQVNDLEPTAKIKTLPLQNELIVVGTIQEVKETVFKIRLIDKPINKVSIELLVVDYNHGKNFEWDFDITSGQNKTISDASFNAGKGGFTYNFLSQLKPSFKVNLTALVENNYANVVTNPHIMALNGENASIDIKETRYLQLQTATINGLTTNLEEVDAGINLTVTPTILVDGVLKLNVNANNAIFLPVEDQAIVNTLNQTINTQVIIRNGETLIIGGLIQAQESSSKQGLPLVSRIPILGWLFRKEIDEKNYIETVIYITPYMDPLIRNDLREYENLSDNIDTEREKMGRKGRRKTF